MSEAKIQFHGKPGTIPQDLCRAKNITAEAKTIFALLTTYKEAYPGQVWLADHVPCSEPTVRSRLRELELHGWLLRVRRNRRANETDLYHVYLSKPLPLSKRAEWVRELGFGESEIRALPKGDYGKEITVKRLPKRAFPKRVEGSAGLKSSDGETPHSSAARTYPPEWYRQNETDYQTIKGVTLTGPEFSPLQRDLKLIYKAGHEPADVKALMDALEASPEAWTDGWTIKTVRMKLAEWKGGKLKLSSNGDRAAVALMPSRDEAAGEVWDAVLAEVRAEISYSSFETWFNETVPFALLNGHLKIAVPDPFTKGGLERRYLEMLNELATKIRGEPTGLIVEVRG